MMTNSCHKGKKIWRSPDLSRKNEMIKSPRTQNPIGPLQFVKTVYKAIRFLGVYCVPVFTGLLRAEGARGAPWARKYGNRSIR